ncbi:T9SS type B sorting domain-containing protein [Flavobacterium sp.]|uniref:T9SS type B sorting domain-containing protein n=1 Tax=Flavobacterium sp. TaxID=239 RepID=UPI00262FC2A8|nr:T9SS type B sorting domain-containing protein [Flavobacterium sp.]
MNQKRSHIITHAVNPKLRKLVLNTCSSILFGMGITGYAQQVICQGTSSSVYKVDATENNGLGTPGSVYSWTIPNPNFSGAISFANPAGTNEIKVNWGSSPAGTYTIQVQEKDAVTGCLGPMQQLTVLLKNAPQPHLENQATCVNPVTGNLIAPVVLNPGIPAAGHTFVWTSNNGTLPNTTPTLSVTQPGTYTVTVTDTASGCQGTTSATISVSSAAVVQAIVKEAFDLDQIIVVSAQGSGDYEYQLNDGPFQDSPIFQVSTAGYYTVRVRDKKGCGDSPLRVLVLNYPRYFTPNGDSYHDYWNIKDLPNPEKANITIFDRYGKLIKQISPKERGWDGTYNGYPLPSTDYWFVLHYYDEGVQKEFKAHFSMKR